MELLPKHSFSHGHGRVRSTSYLSLVSRYIKAILESKETRNVFFFLLLNMSFTVVEFLYGWWNNSLGLTSDAVHMLFDSTAIIFSLVASVITKRDANSRYTYGFGRVETLTGFINALALVFASGNIMWEACGRLLFLSEIELKTDNLLLVSVLGLLVNIVGIFAFDHGGAAHGHAGHAHGEPSGGGHDHGHSHSHSHSHGGDPHHDDHSSHNEGQNPLMHGMFLHILADALGSVGVIVSSLLVEYFGWTWSDPLCSIFISLLTFAGAWPLLKSSGEILLQRTPRSLDDRLGRSLQEVSQLPGVIGFNKQHFWELNQGEYVGSLCVQLARGSDEEYVQMSIHSIFRAIGVKRVSVQLEKDIAQAY